MLPWKYVRKVSNLLLNVSWCFTFELTHATGRWKTEHVLAVMTIVYCFLYMSLLLSPKFSIFCTCPCFYKPSFVSSVRGLPIITIALYSLFVFLLLWPQICAPVRVLVVMTRNPCLLYVFLLLWPLLHVPCSCSCCYDPSSVFQHVSLLLWAKLCWH